MTTFGLSGDAAVRLAAALVLGAFVGFEREASGQPAGLRTHIAVCLGAALFGVVSTLGFLEFRAERAATNVQVDVTRVASQVVVGLGFLGAGVIITRRGKVENLTTAASLWTVAAIGLTAGVGDIGVAGLATAITIGYLVFLRPLRSWIDRSLERPQVTVRISAAHPGDAGPILAALPPTTTARVTGVEKHGDVVSTVVELTGAPGTDLNAVLADVARRSDVTALEAV